MKLILSVIFLSILFAGSIEKLLSINSNIFQAIKNNDLSAVKMILEKNINDLKVLNNDKYSPLHLASESGYLRIVKYLVQKGASINQKNHQENTPLHLASNKKHFPIVKFLASNGADVNIKNFRGRIAALSAIIHYSSFEIIKYLINNRADINTKDLSGATLLSRACGRKYPEVVDLLLKKNIKLPSRENLIISMIYRAVSIDHIRLFNLLINQKPDIKLENEEDYLVLWAVQNGSIKMLELFKKKGFNLNVTNVYGNSTIHLAAKKGIVSIAELLLKNGAKINKKNLIGKTAFHIAKENKKKEMIEFLIRKGADKKKYAFPVLIGPYLGQKTPGKKPELFAPGIVSLEGLEHSPPVFSNDGNQVFWATGFPTNIIGMDYKKGKWNKPEKMDFNSGFGDGEPVFSKKNNKLFFLSRRTLDGKSKSDRERIWYVKRFNNTWSKPICLNNNANLYPMHWTISMDNEDAIYFSSTHASGYGKHDIYIIKTINGTYKKPQNLGPSINSELIENTPYIAPDQSYLICSILGHPESIGMKDLFIFFKKLDGNWSKPVNFGKDINTPGNELCPIVTPDGKYMFYIRGSDIYWVSTNIIRDLKKKVFKENYKQKK